MWQPHKDLKPRAGTSVDVNFPRSRPRGLRRPRSLLEDDQTAGGCLITTLVEALFHPGVQELTVSFTYALI